MNRMAPTLQVVSLACVCMLAAGCLQTSNKAPILDITPPAISFNGSNLTRDISVRNLGSDTLSWTAREVRRVGDVGSGLWEVMDIPFVHLSLNPGPFKGLDTLHGETTKETDLIRVTADRTGLQPGIFTGYGIQITSDGGNITIPLSLEVKPSLLVNPTIISIPGDDDTARFTITNLGPQILNFDLAVISDEGDPGSTVDIPFFVVSMPTIGAVAPFSDQTIEIVITREDLDPSIVEFFVLVTTDTESVVVKITFGVGGVSVFDVVPEAITIAVNIFGNGEDATAEITISNPLPGAFDWFLSFQDPDIPGIPVDLPNFVDITPFQGTLASETEQTVNITIDPGAVPQDGIFDVDIVVNAVDVGSAVVTLRVIAIEGTRLTIRQEPPLRPVGLLDFGQDLDLIVLGVGNTGGVNTRLDFTMTTDRPDLILLPNPSSGRSIGRPCSVFFRDEFFFCFDWVDFPIALDRSAMKAGAEVDGGEIVIEAEGHDPITVAVAVRRSPLTIEGATNQARPPFIQRFILLLRDSLLQSIDTTDPDTLRNITIAVSEDNVPLELDETNFFVTGPEGLKNDLVLMLDFTGSMFHSGEDDGIPNGEKIEEMVTSALEFIDDLPDSFRVSIMEYHEKRQQNRTIHPLSTDKASLRAALESFSISPPNHGESEIFDALIEAIDNLGSQNPLALPFDEADIRSIVFVTDGVDTSSTADLSGVIGLANVNRVRLYPIAFGDQVDIATMISAAGETGGHASQVVGPRTLPSFLGTSTTVGKIWTDLSRQLVLTYITLLDRGANYLITASFIEPSGDVISGSFQRDALFFPGDPRAGQITLTTTGITATGEAEIFVRTDYVPRGINQFRFRFIVEPGFEGSLAPGAVEIVRRQDGGILNGWRLIEEGDGVFFLVTEEDNSLPFGFFGNLVRVTLTGLSVDDNFTVGFRVDNALYQRLDPDDLVNSKFFMYPGGHTNPQEELKINRQGDLAGPAANLFLLQDDSFDPDAPFAYDRDEDGVPDFDDRFPDDELES